MPSSDRRQRRRLEHEDDGPGIGRGCLLTGAVLGVIVGVVFALWGLGPLLRAIYGETTTVGPGDVYEQDARRLEVTSVERVDGFYEVALDVRANRTWDVDETDWELEVETRDDNIPALPPDPARPETGFDTTLGEARTLLLRFEAPTRVDAIPLRLHLDSPGVIFELQDQ